MKPDPEELSEVLEVVGVEGRVPDTESKLPARDLEMVHIDEVIKVAASGLTS